MPPIADRIGISTHFLPSTHGEDIFDAIRAVHQAGFKGFEIVPTLDQATIGYPYNHPNVGVDLFEATDAHIRSIKDALAVFEFVTVHSPHLDWNLASANRHVRKLTWDYYDRCFEFAVQLGAVAMTYHMGGSTHGYQRPSERILEYNAEYAAHLMPRARDLGIPVGYEVGHLPALKYVADRVEGWGINLDIGHAYMAAHTDEGFSAYLDEFVGRIAEVHHNGVNYFWGNYMEHQAPHLNNTIDFQGVYERLRDEAYDGPIICEIMGHDIEQGIAHCQESKDMIVSIWEGTRRLRERWNITQTDD